jgi:hypothetical protein
MGHRLDPELLFQPLRDLECPAPSRAAGAVGDGGEVRFERPQLLERGAEVLPSPVGLGRKELEREDGLVGGGEDLVDAPGPGKSS